MLTRDNMRKKQVQAVDFIKEGYQSLILADVGTGKTVITLTALFDLLENRHISRVLVLAPKRVATDVWINEIAEWSHLERHNMANKVACIAGQPPTKRAAVIDDTGIKIVILNYESLIWLMTEYPQPPFDTLVCDEIDKLKDRTTSRFCGKKKDGKFVFRGMKEYSRFFATVVGLTGTPASNSLLDMWAQCFVIDGGQCLGRSFNKYRRAHFYPKNYSQTQWEVLPTHDKKIHNAIAPIVFRIERDDEIPPVVETPVRWIKPDNDFMKMYRKFEKDLLIYLDDKDISVESPHAAAGYGRLREMASGFSYYTTDFKESKQAVWHHELKIGELQDLISELQGQQLMIVYAYVEQLTMLQCRFGKRLQYLGGGLSDKKARDTINVWNSGSLELLALHPASAGHGLNLQKSGARHIVMLTLPDSAGLYEQVVGRLRRTGNDAESIYVHRILCRATVDEERLAVVQGKIANQQDLLNAMKARCNYDR